MKRHFRQLECPIAGKSVSISLRHGVRAGEPEGPYVRCEERECQYVDLNQPPCPLRVDLFADGSEGRIVAHLKAHAGRRFCYACLMEEAEASHDQVRRASWQVKAIEGFFIGPLRCTLCRNRRITIGFSGEAPVVSTTTARAGPLIEKVAAHLRANPGYGLCAQCLARELAISPTALAHEAMSALDATEGYSTRSRQCVNCLLTKMVIRYDTASGEDDVARRVVEFLRRSPGEVFCSSCLAFANDLTLIEARRISTDLREGTQFQSGEATCSVCERWLEVIGF